MTHSSVLSTSEIGNRYDYKNENMQLQKVVARSVKHETKGSIFDDDALVRDMNMKRDNHMTTSCHNHTGMNFVQ